MAPAFRTDESKQPGLGAAALAGDEHLAEAALIAPSRRAPGQARHFAERVLCPRHAQHAESAVLLATSEMATQAVLGGEGPFEVVVGCRAAVVTVTLTYTTDVLLGDRRIRMADDVAARIIRAVSRDSGVDVVAGRQRLWCVIPTGCVEVATAASSHPGG